MILKILFTDDSVIKYDLEKYMFKGGEHCLTIARNVGWENYDVNTCETIVIPYSNIYQYWTVNESESEVNP